MGKDIFSRSEKITAIDQMVQISKMKMNISTIYDICNDEGIYMCHLRLEWSDIIIEKKFDEAQSRRILDEMKVYMFDMYGNKMAQYIVKLIDYNNKYTEMYKFADLKNINIEFNILLQYYGETAPPTPVSKCQITCGDVDIIKIICSHDDVYIRRSMEMYLYEEMKLKSIL